MKLKDRVAVVAGGSTGIGKAACKLFAQEGAKVVVAARAQPRLDEAVKEIRRFGEATAVQADMSKEADAKRLFESAVRTYGKVDILVATAGGGGPVVDAVADLSLDTWNAVFLINTTATFLSCREALKYMIPASKGVIVTVSSRAAGVGMENRAPYSAAKAGIISFTRALAREVGRYGIRANCLVPGAVLTEALQEGQSAMAAERGVTLEDYRKIYTQGTPLGRMATTEEAARELLFLVSDDSSALTGQALDISCGATMR